MKTALLRPDHLQVWHDFALGKISGMDWERLFEDYVASVDFPVCIYYEELMETFPDAKVILTVRDSQRWWESFNRMQAMINKARWLCFCVPKLRKISQFTDKIVIENVFGGRLEKDSCIKIFERHNEEVRERVPKERLLEFDVSQSWEPLCEFLDVPIPGRPFPQLNVGIKALRKQFLQTVFKGFVRR